MRIGVVGFGGANRALEAKLLPDTVGVESVNQRPGRGDLRAWKAPSTVATVPSGRKSIYRLGRDVASDANYWLTWTTVVSAVRGFIANDTSERTYFTGDGVPKVTDNVIGIATPPFPTAARTLGVPAPILQPSLTQVTAGTGTDETRYYVFTYVTDLGEESAPSPVSAAFVCKPGAQITVGNLGTAAPTGNYGITLKRVYRTQSGVTGETEFFFLREIPIGTSSTTDDGRALGEVLPTTTWLMPPANLKQLHGLHNGMMAGISGRSVRYCEQYKPYAWPLAYETLLADVTPVALGSFEQTLVVLTTGHPYAVNGTSPEAMQETKINLNQACVSETSVQSFGHGVVYASPDGLCYVGTNGPPRVLTAGLMLPEDWRALVPSTIVSGQYGGLYLGFYDDGTGWKGFAIDPVDPVGLFFLETGYPAAFYDRLQDALYVLSGTSVQKWNAGSAMTTRFRSKVFRTPRPANLGYAEVIATGYPVTLRVWSDSCDPVTNAITMVLRATMTVPNRKFITLPAGYLSDDHQLELEVPSGRAVQGVVLADSVAELAQV